MKINKEKLKSNLNKFSNFRVLIDNFFEKKLYNKKGFLKKFISDAKPFIKLNKKRAFNILKEYQKYNFYFTKIEKLMGKIDYEVFGKQNGGFLYNKYDNRYVKTLASIDFIFDIISLIPENMLTKNYNNIYFPYGVTSLLINLFKGDLDFAFYSFISLIPGVGSMVAASAKIVHRILRYILNRSNVEDIEKYYKQIQANRRVHAFLKDEQYDKLNNPYLGDFETDFDLKEIDQLYII